MTTYSLPDISLDEQDVYTIIKSKDGYDYLVDIDFNTKKKYWKRIEEKLNQSEEIEIDPSLLEKDDPHPKVKKPRKPRQPKKTLVIVPSHEHVSEIEANEQVEDNPSKEKKPRKPRAKKESLVSDINIQQSDLENEPTPDQNADPDEQTQVPLLPPPPAPKEKKPRKPRTFKKKPTDVPEMDDVLKEEPYLIQETLLNSNPPNENKTPKKIKAVLKKKIALE